MPWRMFHRFTAWDVQGGRVEDSHRLPAPCTQMPIKSMGLIVEFKGFKDRWSYGHKGLCCEDSIYCIGHMPFLGQCPK
jgi:hypothetical protein